MRTTLISRAFFGLLLLVELGIVVRGQFEPFASYNASISSVKRVFYLDNLAAAMTMHPTYDAYICYHVAGKDKNTTVAAKAVAAKRWLLNHYKTIQKNRLFVIRGSRQTYFSTITIWVQDKSLAAPTCGGEP